MDDFLFGWTMGLFTVIVPYLLYTIYTLKRKLSFLVKPEPKPEPVKKAWWKKW